MGSWDNSILGNDLAHDYLIEITASVVHVVEADLRSMAEDGLLQRPTPVAVLALHALAQNIEAVRALIKPNDVQRWMKAFLTWFDANSQDFGAPNASVIEERQEIARIFKSLIELVQP